jgi:Icc protein
MIVAQLSDTHIVAPDGSPRTPAGFGPVDTAGFLAQAIAAINRLDPLPDVTVITGDLVDRGEPAEYDHLRFLLAP